MNKWTLAPDWAEWFTVGSNGAAYWWQEKPTMIAGRWHATAGKTIRADVTERLNYIERRPQLSLFNMEEPPAAD